MTGVGCQKVTLGRGNGKSNAPEAGPSIVCKKLEEGQCGWGSEPALNPTPSHSTDELTEAQEEAPGVS